MNEDFLLVDRYFCRVCDLQDLDPKSRALVEVWHSMGLIGNGGFHNYLCARGDEATAIAAHYQFVGLLDGYAAIMAAHRLWRIYWPDLPPDESDSGDFRDRFGAELDGIEASFYALEDEIVAKLAAVVRELEQNLE